MNWLGAGRPVSIRLYIQIQQEISQELDMSRETNFGYMLFPNSMRNEPGSEQGGECSCDVIFKFNNKFTRNRFGAGNIYFNSIKTCTRNCFGAGRPICIRLCIQIQQGMKQHMFRGREGDVF
jgi:hypothetical protein